MKLFQSKLFALFTVAAMTALLLAAQSRANPWTAAFFWLLLEIPVQVPLILILAGSWQDLEPAFLFYSSGFQSI
jgi:hypothetical protein